MSESAKEQPDERGPPMTPGLAIRAGVGGALMGLANLVPGISGGTMLVATGVYRAFIDAVSAVTRLQLRPRPLALLGIVGLSAVIAIGGGAGVISLGLAEFRWGMYSLFIGLTLGGAPVLVRLARPMTPAVWWGLGGGAAAMLGLVLAQGDAAGGRAADDGVALLVVAGAAGASAMILPGVSGAYLLLLLGQYRRIVDALKDVVGAGRNGDLSAMLEQLGVILPVGAGVLIGVVVVANVLRVVMHRYEKATFGVLLGLLLAAPAGLWPFKRGVPPAVGEQFDGVLVTAENVGDFAQPEFARDWAERAFAPTPGQVGGSVGLIVVGFGATMGLSLLGGRGAAQDASDGAG